MQLIMITPESSAWEGKWNAGVFPGETGNKLTLQESLNGQDRVSAQVFEILDH